MRHELETGEGSKLGSLDNNGASSQESGSNLAGHDEEGEVPRADSDADTQGSVVHVDVLADVVGLNDLSLPAVSETSVVLVVAGDGICGVCSYLFVHVVEWRKGEIDQREAFMCIALDMAVAV